MSKVICDVCGTSYPETAEQCPICGISRTAGKNPAAAPQLQETKETTPRTPVKGGRFSSKNVRKRNKELNTYQVQPANKGTYSEEEEASDGSNTVLVVLLVILIVVLLAVTGFIFVKFFLPSMMAEEETTLPTSITQETGESTEEITEEPTVPCESLELLSEENAELAGIGQFYLVNVVAMPEDTTDMILYSSSDETVAVINSEGRVEVVGEGVVTITVSCGAQQVSCTFTCVVEEETSEETTEETTEEVTEETLLDITLYLDKSDFTLAYRGDGYQLKFNPELTAEDITWTSENPNVATVENGYVKCISYGTTKVIAKYGDQEVVCIVRCIW